MKEWKRARERKKKKREEGDKTNSGIVIVPILHQLKKFCNTVKI